MQNILMKFDPATGEERPYPSHAAQWREWHGGTAWIFDPWTGRRRDARDVGGDVHGLLIAPAGTLGMDMGGGCSEKDNVACACCGDAGLRYATRRGPSCRWRMMPQGSLPPTCGAAASGARTKWGAADLGQSNCIERKRR